MARKGRVDRGLLRKTDATGRLVWYVRVYHEGKERRFGSFASKTAAREFYEKAKREQKEGRFFPERYQARHRPKPILFQEYVESWLKTQPLKGKKPTTVHSYEGRIRKRILPVFGSVALPAITLAP